MARNASGWQWWQNLKIREKFWFAFSLMLFLLVLIAAISIVTLINNRQKTELLILSSTEIQRLVLEMDNHLESAHRLELDFFTEAPLIGLTDAENTYILPALDHINQGIELSAQLDDYLSQTPIGKGWQKSQINLYLYLTTANRHAYLVDKSIQLVTQLADENSGLLTQFDENSGLLFDLIISSESQEIIQSFLAMRLYEKEYLLSRQRPVMQSAFNIAADLARKVDQTTDLSQSDQQLAHHLIKEHLSIAQEILQIDVEIRSLRNELDLQTEIFNSATDELIFLTSLEIQQAREEIYHANTLVIIFLLVFSGFGIISALFIIRELNRSIMDNIINLTHSALELQSGNLDQRVQTNSNDEFGILADSFNNMADQISTLVGSLEEEVEKRTGELIAERNRAQHYLDIAGVVILVLDEKQRIKMINKKGCELLGGIEEELLGLNWFDNFIPPDQITDAKAVFNQILSGDIEPVKYYENPIIGLDGTKHLIAWHNAILEDDTGKLIGILSSGEDITLRQQALTSQQKAYEQVVARQAAVLNLTEDLRIEIDERLSAENTVKRQNEFLLALQTTTLELLSELDLDSLLENIVSRAAQILNTDTGFLDLVNPETGDLIPRVGIGALEESLSHHTQKGEGVAGIVWETGKPVIIEDYDRWANRVDTFSTNTIHSIIGVPLTSGNKVIGVIGLAYGATEDRNFSQESIEYMSQFAQLATIAIENARLYSEAKAELKIRQQTEKERKKLLSELEKKNRELESFVYTVSHDLKSPLVSISGFSSNLLKRYKDELDGRGVHYLQRLQANVNHMEDLITVLLELSRIGRVVGELTSFSVESLLQEILETHSGQIEKTNARIILNLPFPTIKGDRVRLGQVFSNLLDNAIKFREKDRPLTIEIGWKENELDFLFYVRDNGIGIDPRYSEKIFLPFQKLNPDTEGLGIGIAMVSRIIEYHGGRIWFESEPGEGTTFFFTLRK